MCWDDRPPKNTRLIEEAIGAGLDVVPLSISEGGQKASTSS